MNDMMGGTIVCHYKHPNKTYTVVGTGIIAAIITKPLVDMERVLVYTDSAGRLFVCRNEDCSPPGYRGGYLPVSHAAHIQAREPLKIADRITVYRSDDDDSYWVRSTDEFNDGRFSADHSESTMLWQARYVLRDLHKKHPGCGYGKMADACQRAADRSTGFIPSISPRKDV